VERRKGPAWSRRSLLVMTSVLAFSCVSLTASEIDEDLLTRIAEITIPQQPMGILTVISGKVDLNGNPAQSGLTILTDSKIATDSKGDAVIDIGALGRVELYESTKILLAFTPVQVTVRSDCNKTGIRVIRGKVEVRSPKSQTLLEGEEETYAGSIECVSSGTDFIVDCSGKRRLYPLGGALAPRLLALFGGPGPAAPFAISTSTP
jgi:hypothetical protein